MSKFNNRENERVDLADGREVWLSRACAVVAEVCMYVAQEQTWYVLIGKRGTATPDFQGYWCLPCGYLDWDESLTEGMLREVWEETGLYIPELKEQPGFIYSENPCILNKIDAHETPWSISDKPTSAKQNISFHYAILFSWQSKPFPILSMNYCEPNEVADLKWVKLEEARNMELAFNHAQRVAMLRDGKPELFEKIESTR